ALQPGDTLSSAVESKMILTPEHPLTPKQKYKLVLDPKQTEALKPFAVPLSTATWTAGAGPDETKPSWAGTPSAGPVKLEKKQPVLEIKVPLKDAKGGQVLVELEERGGTNGALEYQFDGKGGSVRLGGECSPLQLKPLAKYHATLTAVDIAGNTAGAG